MDTDELISLHREFLKDSVRLRFYFSTTAQSRGIPPPTLQKPYPADARIVALPGPERFGELGAASLFSLLRLDGVEEFVLYLEPAGKKAG